MESLLQRLDRATADLVERANRSIVQVRNARGGAGAGSVWHADGLVITNAHVVHEEHPTVVLSDGREFSATVLARSKTLDIAASPLTQRGSRLYRWAIRWTQNQGSGSWRSAIPGEC